MPSTSDVKSSIETGSKTYLELIQSNLKEPSQPIAPKTKRERADENWRALEQIICESEQYEKGSDDRAKCLERLHEKLRQLAKRPRLDCLGGGPAPRSGFSSAQEEWVDFLAPSCSLCGQPEDGTCKCEELAANAESFLADADTCHQDTDAGEEMSVIDHILPLKMEGDFKST
uniref:Uncharacterized protein n=1 Tax=Cryptomonas curvata TaxID=233186 RepID=A0A7S0M171_9CRYP|mmetsp:Transcript_1986/g.4054  ORF Transcript_1986/g.4054 Transcript_1986/m.4054 type:complete len:173 (+) Transcript_1986:78-596(+)